MYIKAGKEFGSECGNICIVKIALYCLNSSESAFRSKLVEFLHNINYQPSLADPDVWMRPATKPNGFKHYEYIICYVDNVSILSQYPQYFIDGITAIFKLKKYKAETPNVYLGAQIDRLTLHEGTEYWSISSVKYLKAVIETFEQKL